MKKVTAMQNAKSACKSMRRLLLLVAATWPLIGTAGLDASKDLALLTVKGHGLYRVTYDDFASSGVLLDDLTHRQLTISLNGQQLPVNSIGRVVGKKFSNKFGPGGYLEFFVPESINLYSDEAALVLGFEKRTATMSKQRSRFSASDAASTTFTQTLTVEENKYYDFASPAHNDPWHYGPVIAMSDADVKGTQVTFALPGLVSSSVDLTAEFVGITDFDIEGNDHHIVGLVNGVEVGDEQFDGNVLHAINFPDASVSETNTFRFDIRSIAATPYTVAALNKLTVKYDRSTQVTNDYLDGEFSPNKVFEVSGFSTDNIDVYAIGVDGAVDEVILTEIVGSGTIKFKTNASGGRYVVAARSGYMSVGAIQAAPVLEDISTGDAEYLIIAHSDFIGAPALDTLVNLRSAKYSVKVVDVEQLYYQFSDLHLPSAEAISNYIRFAQENLGTQFVLLVGGDTYDYKGYDTKHLSKSFIPTQYVTTRGDNLVVRQAPSDAKYGDLDDDGIPDLPVGRFPVRTATELANIVEKIGDYEARVGYANRILMVADQADNGNGVNFTKDAIALIDGIPSAWAGSVRNDYRAFPDLDGGQVARDKIFAAINAGVSVTAYIGHSGATQWARSTPTLLRNTDIAAFTNFDKPTVVTQWGCWNTYFVHPEGNRMAETFLNSGLNGAATVLGASTLTKASSEFLLASELNKHMYNKGEPIGTAVIKAKQALALIEPGASDVLLGWQILGDPALVINH